MSRTTIVIDDRLLEIAMRVHGFKTKRAVVDFALRRLVGNPMTRDQMLAMHGTGWDGDLDEMRSQPLPWDR